MLLWIVLNVSNRKCVALGACEPGLPLPWRVLESLCSCDSIQFYRKRYVLVSFFVFLKYCVCIVSESVFVAVEHLCLCIWELCLWVWWFLANHAGVLKIIFFNTWMGVLFLIYAIRAVGLQIVALVLMRLGCLCVDFTCPLTFGFFPQ